MIKNALVIGATGLLGYGVTVDLFKAGWNVRAIGKDSIDSLKITFLEGVEYLRGDFYEESFLSEALTGIDKVFFFLSSTFPSTSSESLELEITRTLRGLDYLLRKMRDMAIKEIVFPSSGGTVYGDVGAGRACETDILYPTTPYGVGKKMCEEILRFYASFGVSSTILRVGNVYGSPLVRKSPQGVIDVFVQNALQGREAKIWGNAIHNIRDYIFVDDFSKAVALIGEYESKGIEIYNLSSGVGTSLDEIIQIINKYSDAPLKIDYVQNNATDAIKRIVLDMEQFKKKTGWKQEYDIERGIKETINRKKMMMLEL